MKDGLCECGCGGKTTIIKRSDSSQGRIKGQPNKYITGHHLRGESGEKSGNWRGGNRINNDGYVLILAPWHRRADIKGYAREHILIAEKALGGPLPEGCQIHHYGDVGDNSKLVICQDQKYHHLLHVRARSLEGCGNANKRKCKYCQEYDDVDNLYCKPTRTGSRGWNVYHRSCARAYDRKMRAEGRGR